MPNDRIALKIAGLSISPLSSGAYALILAEIDGPMKIPVIITRADAQAIALRLEQIASARPNVYDLFASFGQAFGAYLESVFIYKFEEGVFFSEVTFTDGDRTVRFEARTSDALNIALRTHSPIYTTREIIEATGFILDELDAPADKNDEPEASPEQSVATVVAGLREKLARCIEDEDYEEAARLTSLINRLTDDSGSANTEPEQTE